VAPKQSKSCVCNRSIDKSGVTWSKRLTEKTMHSHDGRKMLVRSAMGGKNIGDELRLACRSWRVYCWKAGYLAAAPEAARLFPTPANPRRPNKIDMTPTAITAVFPI
jgi:hypothetical protein